MMGHTSRAGGPVGVASCFFGCVDTKVIVMPIEILTVYAVALTGVILAQLAPGPNLLAVASAALGQGLQTAIWVTLGIATAIFLWITVATFGLATLLAVYPPLLIVMKIAGGGYLLFLAARSARAALVDANSSLHAERDAWTGFQAWRRGLLVNLSNPKSALMWGAITTFMFGSGLTTTQVLGFAPIGFASATLIYGTYAALFSTGVARGIYARFTRSVSAVFAAAFGALGGSLIFDGVRDIAK